MDAVLGRRTTADRLRRQAKWDPDGPEDITDALGMLVVKPVTAGKAGR